MSDNKHILKLDTNIYPLEAIWGACYACLDKYYIKLDKEKDDEVIVDIEPKEGETDKPFTFLDELLSYIYRMQIIEENKTIREHLVDQAIYGAVEQVDDMSGGLLGADDDPLGIAVPWEEKYGKSALSILEEDKAGDHPKPRENNGE